MHSGNNDEDYFLHLYSDAYSLLQVSSSLFTDFHEIHLKAPFLTNYYLQILECVQSSPFFLSFLQKMIVLCCFFKREDYFCLFFFF